MPETNTTTRPAPSPGRRPAPGTPHPGQQPGQGHRPPPPPLPQRPGYTLTRDDVDDAHPQEWVLRRIIAWDATTTEVLARWRPPLAHGEAQQLATEYLYQQQIRVAAWNPGQHSDEFVASVGATFNAWQVLAYSGRGGMLWRRGADGSFTGRGGSCYDEKALARHQGPLTPVEVHNLPALIAELEIYRKTAGYLEAATAACLDHDCDEYYADDGRETGIDMCSHVETRIATAAESAALARVLNHLKTLEQTSTPAEEDIRAGRFTPTELAEMAGVRETVAELRSLIEQEDE